MAFVCLCVLFLNTHIVKANDDHLYFKPFESATFNNKDYDVVSGLINPLNDFGDNSNYTFSWFHVNSSGWGWADSTLGYVVSSGVQNYGIQIQFPETVSKDTSIDLSFKIKTTIANINTPYITFIDSSGSSKGTADITVSKTSTDTYLFSATDLTPMGAYSRIRIQFKGNNSSNFTPFIDGVSIDVSFNDNIASTTSGIFDTVKKIFTGISDLPSKISSGLKTFFDNIVTSVSNMSSTLVNSLSSLGSNIINGLSNLGNFIVNGLKTFFDTLTNAVVALGNFLIDGLKTLFIPSIDDFNNLKNKWDLLLEDRFGGLYQAIDYTISFYQGFSLNYQKTISIPLVTVPLLNGESFVFGGWTFQIVPTGLSFLAEACKTIISIVVTLSFINALKNRFDELIGGGHE